MSTLCTFASRWSNLKHKIEADHKMVKGIRNYEYATVTTVQGLEMVGLCDVYMYM